MACFTGGLHFKKVRVTSANKFVQHHGQRAIPNFRRTTPVVVEEKFTKHSSIKPNDKQEQQGLLGEQRKGRRDVDNTNHKARPTTKLECQQETVASFNSMSQQRVLDRKVLACIVRPRKQNGLVPHQPQAMSPSWHMRARRSTPSKHISHPKQRDQIVAEQGPVLQPGSRQQNYRTTNRRLNKTWTGSANLREFAENKKLERARRGAERRRIEKYHIADATHEPVVWNALEGLVEHRGTPPASVCASALQLEVSDSDVEACAEVIEDRDSTPEVFTVPISASDLRVRQTPRPERVPEAIARDARDGALAPTPRHASGYSEAVEIGNHEGTDDEENAGKKERGDFVIAKAMVRNVIYLRLANATWSRGMS
eukprot:Clim_evm18s242 gene=Clim_evmTU18s242